MRNINIPAVCAAAALSVLCAALITDGYIRAGEHAYLNLTQPSLTLHKGDAFEPMKYVASYSDDADMLSLPSSVNTAVTGSQAAVYRLTVGKEEITRILLVTVTE